ncbi:hypothetical protein K4L44_10760 [Halosquirtibacter laminarini]|uniref:Uncharacterized protein n=1 Tax=Halosquirtibacter laminarini TaxID=3374600 RepID=A0AC61NMN8_9BACT|nr:hypothetical protein K4L44_10760 [Prolixibacteraceae bacterium]
MHPSNVKIGQNEYRTYQLITLIEEGKIHFEQNIEWNTRHQSMSIESILLGLTMTPFYVDASDPNAWFLLDGNKRLYSLSRFLKGNFCLNSLDFFPNLNGCYFADLSFGIQRKLTEAMFKVYTINQGVSAEIRYNLALRIVPDLQKQQNYRYIETLLDSQCREALKDWLNGSSYDFIKKQFDTKSSYRFVLEYFRIKMSLEEEAKINLNTPIEQIVFRLNNKGVHGLSSWKRGMERISYLFKDTKHSYLNKKTIPIWIYILGEYMGSSQYEEISHHRDIFLEEWANFYLKKENSRLFTKANPKEIYNKMIKWIDQ